MKLNKIFLLLLLSLLFVGLSYATEVSNDTTADTSTVSVSTTEEVVTSSNTEINEADNTITDQTNKKEIMKQNNTKNVKTESKTIDVNDFNTLHNTLTSDTYDTLTLNIKSDIKLTDNTELNTAIKTLAINGNGKTINGNNQYRFLYIESDSKVTLKNIKILNCYSEYNGGAIYNSYGTLTITNTTLNNNTVQEAGGAIYNEGYLTLDNSILKYNEALINGGAIYNENSLNITNCTLNDNQVNSFQDIIQGGAIYNEGVLNVANSILNNNQAISGQTAHGGAIYNSGNLTITGTTLNNNKAIGGYSGGGGIYNIDNMLNINNCTLNNNKAFSLSSDYETHRGGAICNIDSRLVISKSELYNNGAQTEGGAIYNSGGHITITENTLEWNYVRGEFDSGGAIYNTNSYLKISYINITNSLITGNQASSGGGINNHDGTIIITKSTLKNNEATNQYGGAIINSDVLNINNCTFIYNNAKYDGGAICNSGNLTIENSTLKNNQAKGTNANGGAIYNTEISKITGNIFENNIAQHGSAIYSEYIDSKTLINNNTFKKNKSNSTGTAIIDNGINTIIKNNKNDQISKYNSTIEVDGTNNSITNNIFDDGTINTKITINKIANTQYTDTTTITGTLKTSTGTPIKSTIITISINTKKYTTKTDNDGAFTYNYTTNTPGTNNITVTYTGTTEYSGTSAKTTFKVTPKTTKITLNKISNTQYTDTATIKGTLKTSSGTVLKSVTLTVNVNGKKVGTTKTNSNGIFTYKYTTKTPGKNNVTLTYAGNIKYKVASAKTTFKVTPKTTKIVINKIANTQYTNNATIKGTLKTSSGTVLKSIKLTVNINSKKYTATTNSKGIFTLKYTTKTPGTNNVTVAFAGTTKYSKASTKTTFKVTPKTTKITISKIAKTKKGKTVTITGKCTDTSGRKLVSTTVKVTVNGVKYTVKTKSNGVYTLKYKTSKVGTNNVTVSYPGNSKYLSSSIKTTFKVVKT